MQKQYHKIKKTATDCVVVYLKYQYKINSISYALFSLYAWLKISFTLVERKNKSSRRTSKRVKDGWDYADVVKVANV